MRNLPIITKVVDVKRSANFWSIGPSILADWIKNRYIRGQALDIIQVRPNVDSAIWKHILVQKEAIMEVLGCGTNYILMWRKRNRNNKIGSIVQTIRPTSIKDPLTKGIWFHMPTKFPILLWRVRWASSSFHQVARVGDKHTNNLFAMSKRGLVK